MPTEGRVDYINPPELPASPAFTNVVVASGPVRTVYVGAQTPIGPDGGTVGKGDVGRQTAQVLENVKACLAAGGADLSHIALWTIYMVDGQDPRLGFEAFRNAWGDRPNPPANTVLRVAGFPNPDWLVAIDAVAVVPEVA